MLFSCVTGIMNECLFGRSVFLWEVKMSVVFVWLRPGSSVVNFIFVNLTH